MPSAAPSWASSRQKIQAMLSEMGMSLTGWWFYQYLWEAGIENYPWSHDGPHDFWVVNGHRVRIRGRNEEAFLDLVDAAIAVAMPGRLEAAVRQHLPLDAMDLCPISERSTVTVSRDSQPLAEIH